MEDPKKVQDKVDELNKKYKTDKWDSVTGFHSTALVTMNGPSQSVDPLKGVTYKLFVNTETGEIKFFYYKNFLKTIKLRTK